VIKKGETQAQGVDGSIQIFGERLEAIKETSYENRCGARVEPGAKGEKMNGARRRLSLMTISRDRAAFGEKETWETQTRRHEQSRDLN